MLGGWGVSYLEIEKLAFFEDIGLAVFHSILASCHPHKRQSERKLLSVHKHRTFIYSFLQTGFIKH